MESIAHHTRSRRGVAGHAVLLGTPDVNLDLSREMALPCRRSEGRVHAEKDAPDYVMKLSASKRAQVYQKYYEYRLTSIWGMRESYKRRMLNAHYHGLVGVAYLECHCRECRFVSSYHAPSSSYVVAGCYEHSYEAQIPNLDAWLEASQCLIVQTYKHRAMALACQGE